MITKDNHKKHPDIKRPRTGTYHYCEWAVYGTTCQSIDEFVSGIQRDFSGIYNILYVDADHHTDQKGLLVQHNEKRFLAPMNRDWNSFDDKFLSTDYDAVFVNGNHYSADSQIVIIDPLKKDSLFRRKDQLNNIQLVILKSQDYEIFDFISELISDDTPIIVGMENRVLIDWISEKLNSNIPKLNALILAGGESKRMGVDKSRIIYHEGKPMEAYLADSCISLDIPVSISKAHDFDKDFIGNYPVIKDKFPGMGPFGAIISAFLTNPDVAWLVLACDLPFMDKDLIMKLIDGRDPSVIATTIKGKTKQFPEPLITIYEPRAKMRFFNFLSLGYNCPRKVVINSLTKDIEIENEQQIENINTIEEKSEALKKINS